MKFDYLIIGAGTAGCVLANRLSEKIQNNVAIFEAGKKSDIWKVNVIDDARAFPTNIPETIRNGIEQEEKRGLELVQE